MGLIICNIQNPDQTISYGRGAQEPEWDGGIWVYYSRENVSQKRLNLPERLPKGMNYEGIYGRPTYSHVYFQFMADRSKSRKATLKPLKTACFIAPLQHCTVTVGLQTTPRGPASTAILIFLISEA